MTITKSMNWQERIDRAIERGDFSIDDLECSVNWESCVASELDVRIETGLGGDPEDVILSDLCKCFSISVAHGTDVGGAAEIYKSIKQREAEILEEL